jgi:hypothetical protein
MKRLAKGIEGVIADHRGNNGKAADRDEGQQQPPTQAMSDCRRF